MHNSKTFIKVKYCSGGDMVVLASCEAFPVAFKARKMVPGLISGPFCVDFARSCCITVGLQ